MVNVEKNGGNIELHVEVIEHKTIFENRHRLIVNPRVRKNTLVRFFNKNVLEFDR
jgi:hypothetical protein